MFVHTRERDSSPGFDGVKIKFYYLLLLYYYYYYYTSEFLKIYNIYKFY